MQEVEIAPLPLDRFESVLGPHRYRRFVRSLEPAADVFRGRTVWCVNSTPKGGGVAELLASITGYAAGAGVSTRWLVIDGDDDFFLFTKRLHNHLHGEPGDERQISDADRDRYEGTLRQNAAELEDHLDPRDVVIVHDPQPAGLVPILKRSGAAVIWRCHIGVDEPNDTARQAWEFLRPYVAEADACVFSRRAYVWSGLDRAEVIAPSIDAFSPKNQDLAKGASEAILRAAGIVEVGTGSDDSGGAEPEFIRQDGSPGVVSSQATLIQEEPLPASAPLVVQVSRWDRLKDPVGVLEGFGRNVPTETGAHLLLAGPRDAGVTDDPEQDEVLEEVRSAWEALPGRARARVHVACLPVEDDEENSAIVNALQRRANVVVQKSLVEGFGLTVAEAMWKERTVVATRVGGIQDQIEDGESGVLLEDPEDLLEFGRVVTGLLQDGERSDRIGKAARERVRDEFLPTRHVAQWADLIRSVLSGKAGP